MKYFKVKYSGLGNADTGYEDFLTFKDRDEALTYCQENALEEFLSYGGTQGYGEELDNWLEDNPGSTSEDWYSFMEEEANSWVDYIVEELTEEEFNSDV